MTQGRLTRNDEMKLRTYHLYLARVLPKGIQKGSSEKASVYGVEIKRFPLSLSDNFTLCLRYPPFSAPIVLGRTIVQLYGREHHHTSLIFNSLSFIGLPVS